MIFFAAAVTLVPFPITFCVTPARAFTTGAPPAAGVRAERAATGVPDRARTALLGAVVALRAERALVVFCAGALFACPPPARDARDVAAKPSPATIPENKTANTNKCLIPKPFPFNLSNSITNRQLIKALFTNKPIDNLQICIIYT